MTLIKLNTPVTGSKTILLIGDEYDIWYLNIKNIYDETLWSVTGLNSSLIPLSVKILTIP